MIGSDPGLSPARIQIGSKPLANALGIQGPQYVGENAIADAQNNAIAKGYQTPRVQARQGFSNGRNVATRQGLQDAASLSQAANQAAGIGAETQAYNASLRDQHSQMRDKTLADRRSGDLAIHDALLARRNSGQQVAQQLRLDNEVQKDRLKYSLLGRMI